MATTIPKNPTPETQERVDAVMAYAAEHGWTRRALKHHRELWGVCNQTIRHYRRIGLLQLKEQDDADEEAGVVRTAFVADVDRHIEAAAEDGNMGPVMAGLRIKQTVLGLEKAPQSQDEPTPGEALAAFCDWLASDADAMAAFVEGMGERGWVVEAAER